MIEQAIQLLSQPSTSQILTQLIGLAFLFVSINSDDDIVAQSGTYWDYNDAQLHGLIFNRYDQTIGVFVTILPTMAQSISTCPFWINYIFLVSALILRLPAIRNLLCKKTIKKLEARLNSEPLSNHSTQSEESSP